LLASALHPSGTIARMRTVVLGPRPAELDALIARRQALGHDRYDEVWNGEYHMAPAPNQRHGDLVMAIAFALARAAKQAGLTFTDAFNLGEPDDYRVPDLGLHRTRGRAAYVPTAAMVVEVVSPSDESWEKFDHYAGHRVDEVMIADPADQTVALFVLDGDEYRRCERSDLLDLTIVDIHGSIDWPEPGA
jgi:Uma2 family endonuclease